MQTVTEICNLWPSDAELARDLQIPYPTVAAWKQRGSIPAGHWRDLVRAAQARNLRQVTTDLLADLHARTNTRSPARGFGESEPAPYRPPTGSSVSETGPNASVMGHFSRFKHLRRSNFVSAEEVADHVRALRDEWDRR